MKRFPIQALAFLAVLGAGHCADKPMEPENLEVVISGRVVDAESGQPVAGAVVSTDPPTEQVLTNAAGEYTLRAGVRAGESYRITAGLTRYAQNFIAISAREGENRMADLQLSPAVPELGVSPEQLNFGTEAEELILQVENAGNDTLEWRIEVDESWPVVSVLRGENTGSGKTTVTVKVQRRGLPAEYYQARITVTSNGGSKAIPVSMEILHIPRLEVDRKRLDFGAVAVIETVELDNTGTGRLTWNVQEEVEWLETVPAQGTILGATTQLVFTVDRTGLEPGVYTAQVKITSDGGGHDLVVEAAVAEAVVAGSETMEVTTPAGAQHQMVLVPAGAFEMGSESGDQSESPVHTVRLDAYWIDQIEVTNAQFRRFVEATHYETKAESEGQSWVYSAGFGWKQVFKARWNAPRGPGSNITDLLNHPVVHVSWADALTYCDWAGLRLPTEAEWEKAARGTDERTYPWGEEVDRSRANYGVGNCCGPDDSDRYFFTSPAGVYARGISPYGVHDMAGNVWEWVVDWYGSEYYARSPERNPQGPGSGSRRVLRGGSWADIPIDLRASYRIRVDPQDTIDINGFRCARDF